MAILLFAALVSSVVSGHSVGSQDYAQAYRDANEQDKPLLVVVGADWCPACVNLKSQTIDSLKSAGELDDVCVAVVDQDSQPKLAARLKRGPMLPQVIVFSKNHQGTWKRTHLSGFQSRGTLQSVLKSAKQRLSRGI